MRWSFRVARVVALAFFASATSVIADVPRIVTWNINGGDSGDDDFEDAAKRENNSGGVALDTSSVLAAGRSIVIGGDLNIQPIGKHARVGSNVSEDCTPSLNNCGKDGYDGSIKIVQDIGNGCHLLSEDVPPTYLRGDFGPGAIDHLVVAGTLARDFDKAGAVSVSGDAYFESNHCAVFTGIWPVDGSVLRSSSIADENAREEHLRWIVREVRERLDAIERMVAEDG